VVRTAVTYDAGVMLHWQHFVGVTYVTDGFLAALVAYEVREP